MAAISTAAEVAAEFKVRPSTVMFWHRIGRVPSERRHDGRVFFDLEKVREALRSRPNELMATVRESTSHA